MCDGGVNGKWRPHRDWLKSNVFFPDDLVAGESVVGCTIFVDGYAQSYRKDALS